MNKIGISIIIGGVIIAGAIALSGSRGGQTAGSASAKSADNVSVVDGKQIVEITARGGYFPGISTAKADIPTVIRVKTNGTYDCSSAISIPSLGVRTRLPASGSTDFDVPAQQSGAKLLGTCAMGMYRFQINFQ